ncbi:MAG: DUF1826 domain-containing protein [Pseudomonadaceae bacterium]|jgi:hypothetical protein|nr:DUF1826 domain-containing protein [Pseudomonadaceae bacterium]
MRPAYKLREAPRQVQGSNPQVLAEVLAPEVNLAVYERQLSVEVEQFVSQLLALGQPLAESLSIDWVEDVSPAAVAKLASGYQHIPGHAAFLADLNWLLSAYACLLGAKRIGLRLRILEQAMCPRFHVDHVPLRLITSYAGAGSQWLREDAMSRASLADAEAQQVSEIEQVAVGAVALVKGEKWLGNEGRGLIHRSPPVPANTRRLLLTLDWLA